MNDIINGIVHPKTGEVETPPESNPLMVDVKDGKIVDVGPFQHRVDWVDGGISGLSYCNNCGCAMFYSGDFLMGDGTKRKGKVCVKCDCWLGFFDE